ncbi:MAG TPA: branched-chain amino acid ABC transporter ATP-binding protein/permease [Burkholderiales bacterium]|jgi:branched-chain amino acid transport system ATP-binding protein|nr:branched-chain amino acid ABC transporter ATP-binding protein/permease [Burkholderiales bacterium]
MSPARLLRHPLAIAAIGIVLLPYFVLATGFTYSTATEIALMAMVALGFNLLLGYTGLLSFGHGLFFGIAAYSATLSQIHWFRDSFFLPLLTAVALGVLLGLVVGFLVLRRRGVYFSLITLAFTALVFYIAFRWTSFTGGENGLSGIQRPVVLGLDLDSAQVYYWFCCAIVLLVMYALLRVVHSPLGSVLKAIRENETRARFVGYPVGRFKLAAFVISATVTSLGGALTAFLKLFVSADFVHPNFSGEILAMTIFGGVGSFLGPALGAFAYLMMRAVLSAYTDAWQFWFGLMFMGFILFSPLGLVGIGQRLLAPLLPRRTVAGAMAQRVVPQPGQSVPDFLKVHAPGHGRILACQAVTKRFGDFAAVDRVDFELEDRRLHALIGPNGAGKTTLFNAISGMFAPDAGAIRLGGQRIEGRSADEVVARGLARSFQITSLFLNLTVWENLRLACQARDPQRLNAWKAADALTGVNGETRELVRFLGLEGLEQAAAADLSYGGQRLVEIGLALATRPRVLLLDEPLAGLAAAERERISRLIRGLTEHMAVLLVEHDIDRVFDMADRITVMNEGRVLVEGDSRTVRTHPEVQRVYIGSGHAHLAARRSARERTPERALLALEGVNTFYGKSHILHDVSLVVREKEVTALLGRNGAGKSSTFKSILGIARPASGKIEFDGRLISGQTPEKIARLGIGLVPQGRRLFSGLTVEENLRLGALARRTGAGLMWDREKIYQYFPRVREKLHTRADQLSGGEQQMVAIARALSGNVKLLLLDEPFEGLSPAMVEEVFRTIENLRREVSILIIEHHLDLVLALADRAYVLDRGYVSHEGPAEPLLTDLEFRKQVLWL